MLQSWIEGERPASSEFPWYVGAFHLFDLRIHDGLPARPTILVLRLYSRGRAKLGSARACCREMRRHDVMFRYLPS